MKYCRSCKTRARDTETNCTTCGQPLATLGEAAEGAARPAGGAGAPTLSLQGQIRELQVAQTQIARRSRLFGTLVIMVLAALLLTLYGVYSKTILAYAVLRDVKIEQDPAEENRVRVSFDVVTPGKVAYDRQSGGERTEKIDVFEQPGRNELAWTWPSAPRTGIDFQVVYRGGLTRKFVHKQFPITGKRSGGLVDIVFLLDTTSSMDPFIKGLKEKCIEFAQIVATHGNDIRLGLIGFGDVEDNEPIYVLDPTPDLRIFQGAVAQVPRTNGGDIPESSVEALGRALKIQYRTGAAVCFVHITDANCHHTQELIPLAAELLSRKIVTYVVSQKEYAQLYQPICVNGGVFFAIEEANFEEILLNVAQAITNQISYK